MHLAARLDRVALVQQHRHRGRIDPNPNLIHEPEPASGRIDPYLVPRLDRCVHPLVAGHSMITSSSHSSRSSSSSRVSPYLVSRFDRGSLLEQHQL